MQHVMNGSIPLAAGQAKVPVACPALCDAHNVVHRAYDSRRWRRRQQQHIARARILVSAAADSSPQLDPAPPYFAASAGSSPVWTDRLSETQRFVLADEWGFSAVGTSMPSGLDVRVLWRALPMEVLVPDMQLALRSFTAPALLLLAGFAWQSHMHDLLPVWQQLATWLLIGTGYTGLFQLARQCVRGNLFPDFPGTQEVLGTILMAPSLNCFEVVKTRLFHHFHQPTQLWHDVQGPWHPLTLEQLALAGPWERAWLRLQHTTLLKLLLTSMADWADSLQAWDLRNFYQGLRHHVLLSWAAPAAFLGIVLPVLVACLGWQGLVNCWLGPWLVFHAWSSTLGLLQHRAPHIPWREPGLHQSGWDRTRAVVGGTVTSPLPGWLEVALNYANYPLPELLVWPGVPCYHARQATEALREKLWPHMHEAPVGLRLLVNHVTRWHVYDTQTETWMSWEEAEESLAKLKADWEEQVMAMENEEAEDQQAEEVVAEADQPQALHPSS